MIDDKLVPLAVYSQDQRSADEAMSGGGICGVCRDGIEYTTSAKSLRGVAFLLGGVGGGSRPDLVVGWQQ